MTDIKSYLQLDSSVKHLIATDESARYNLFVCLFVCLFMACFVSPVYIGGLGWQWCLSSSLEGLASLVSSPLGCAVWSVRGGVGELKPHSFGPKKSF